MTDIVLGQVMDLRALPSVLRARARDLVVARRPAGSVARRLDGSRACERAVGQLPALGPWLDCRRVADRVLAAAGSPTDNSHRPHADCAMTTRAIAQGEAPRAEDFRPSACAARAPAFRYDPASGLSRSRRDLTSGEPVAVPPAFSLAEVGRDQHLILASRVGPVRVERQVTAVRPARRGARLMVRGADGTVFDTPALEAAP